MMKRVTILGKTWKVHVMSGDRFIKKIGEELDGITYPSDKRIVLNADGLTLSTMRHELGHAYFESLCVTPANLTNAQVEEVMCEMFAEYGTVLLAQADELYKLFEDEVE